MTSHLLFPLLGLVSLLVGWPLARRRIAPNRWYGVRVASTLSTPAIWYEANAVCGDELVRMGLVLLVIGIALRFVPGLPEVGYVAICIAVFLAGSVRATTRSLRIAKWLSRSMRNSRLTLAVVVLSLALIHPATAQQAAVVPDSAEAQIRAVLRAFYLNLETQNWDGLAAYVLSPKLLERRGAPGDLQMVARDRTRSRGWSHPAAAPVTCPSGSSSAVEAAAIRVDGDWADVSVPRCDGTASGVDELGLLYFEGRWRFIYTDLFQGSAPAETAKR